MYIHYKPPKNKIPRKVKYDTPISMNFDKKTLEEFKQIVGKGYQVKIRELVREYIEKYKRDINEKM